MGCDIHVNCEKYVEINGESKWTNVDLFRKNPYFGVHEGESEYELEPAYVKRSYNLFTELACVRGQGGLRPKGLPADMSPETKQQYFEWGTGAHSMSYLNLRELFDLCSQGKCVEDFLVAICNRVDDMSSYWNSFGVLYDKYKEDPKVIENYRVVFWFDN